MLGIGQALVGPDAALLYDHLAEVYARAAEADLLALSPVKPGHDLLTADVEGMERAMLRHPWVAAATVHRRLPRDLEIEVTEREPRLLVDLGGTYLVLSDQADVQLNPLTLPWGDAGVAQALHLFHAQAQQVAAAAVGRDAVVVVKLVDGGAFIDVKAAFDEAALKAYADDLCRLMGMNV